MTKSKILFKLKAVLNAKGRGSDEFTSKREFIDSLFDKSFEEFDSHVVLNVKKIVEHYFIEENLQLDQIERMLDGTLDTQLDSIVTGVEARDNFDSIHGTTTTGMVDQFDMGEVISVDRFKNSARYVPAPVGTIQDAFSALESLNVDFRKFMFLEIGSGMGRNLLIASEHPFEKIIGVELSRYLVNIAERNIAIYNTGTQQCKNLVVYCQDALEFDLPPGKNMVIYFWEPFPMTIFEKFLQELVRITESRSPKIYLIALNNTYTILDQSTTFKLAVSFNTTEIANGGDFLVSIYSN